MLIKLSNMIISLPRPWFLHVYITQYKSKTTAANATLTRLLLQMVEPRHNQQSHKTIQYFISCDYPATSTSNNTTTLMQHLKTLQLTIPSPCCISCSMHSASLADIAASAWEMLSMPPRIAITRSGNSAAISWALTTPTTTDMHSIYWSLNQTKVML